MCFASSYFDRLSCFALVVNRKAAGYGTLAQVSDCSWEENFIGHPYLNKQ